MNRLLLVIAALVLVGLIVWALVNFQEEGEPGLRSGRDRNSQAISATRGDRSEAFASEDEAASNEPDDATDVEEEDEIDLPPGGLTGLALDPDGKPLVGASVRVSYQPRRARGPGNERKVRTTRTGRDGRFRLPGTRLNAYYSFRVRAEHHTDVERNGEIAGGESIDLGTLRTEPGVALKGRVVDEAGEALADALILAHVVVDDGFSSYRHWYRDQGVFERMKSGRDREARSDADGRFTIGGLREGTLFLKVTAEGRPETQRDDLRISLAASPIEVEVTVETGQTLRGRVVDREGQPVADAIVKARDEWPSNSGMGSRRMASNRRAPIRTDALGRFEVEGLDPVLDHRLRVLAEGFLGVSDFLVERSKNEVEIVLLPAPRLHVVVLDSAGEPLAADVEVSAVAASPEAATDKPKGRPVTEPVADRVGEFRVTDIPERSVYLEVEAAGHAAAFVVLNQLEPGVEREVEVVLERGFALRGRVVDDAGRPAPDVTVDVHEMEESRFPRRAGAPAEDLSFRAGRLLAWARSAAHGSFELSDLPSGDFVLRVWHPGHLRSDRAVTVSDSTPEVELVIRRAALVRGQVLDALGQPVPKAGVTLTSLDPDPRIGSQSRRAEADGSFEFGGLRPGRYRMRADAASFPRSTRFYGGTVEEPEDGEFVELVGGEEREIDLLVEKRASIHGLATCGGLPTAGVELLLAKIDKHPEVESALTDYRTRAALSDEKGRFEFVSVEPGKYAILVRSLGSTTINRANVEVSGTDRARCDIDLPGGAVAGRVLSAADGRPLTHATVRLERAESIGTKRQRHARRRLDRTLRDDRMRARSSKDGDFEIAFIDPGEYRLIVESPGLVPHRSETITVTESRIDGLEIGLERGSSISVKVTAPNAQNPGQFLRCEIRSLDEGNEIRDGRFSEFGQTVHFSGLAPGRYRVKASLDDMRAEHEFDIGAEANLEIELTLH